MKCARCNNEIKENMKFCNHCGMPIQHEQDNGKIKCSNCGSYNKAENSFCINCGTTITARKNDNAVKNENVLKNDNVVNSDELKDSTNEKPKKKNNIKKFIKIVIILLLIIILLIGAMMTLCYVKYGNIDKIIDSVSVFMDNTDAEDVESQNFGENSFKTMEPAQDAEEQMPSKDGNDVNDSSNMNPDIDVEEETSRIRERYNDIVLAISLGEYEQMNIKDGVVAYYDNNKLKSITVAKGTGGIEYNRLYYYDNDKLFFAYYEGDDSHRFYFLDDKLIRWRYLSGGSEADGAVDYDMADSDKYRAWENKVWNDSINFLEEWRGGN